MTCFHSHTVFFVGFFSYSSSFSSFADIPRPLQVGMTVVLLNGNLILQAASMYRTGSQGTSTTMRAFLEQRSSPSSPAHADLEDSPNACGWRAGFFTRTDGCALKHHIVVRVLGHHPHCWSKINKKSGRWVFARTAAFTFKHQSAAEETQLHFSVCACHLCAGATKYLCVVPLSMQQNCFQPQTPSRRPNCPLFSPVFY